MDIIEILKLGLPGLVFLLSLLSYRLLTKEQDKKNPSQLILRSIKQYMYLNIFLAILTMSGSIIEEEFFAGSDSTVFNVKADTGIRKLTAGDAAVCINADYTNRYLLLKDTKTGKVIQVYAKTVIPCTNGDDRITLNQSDALNLGWKNGITDSLVEVVLAMPGQKFII